MAATPSASKWIQKNVRTTPDKMDRNWGDEIGAGPYKINLQLHYVNVTLTKISRVFYTNNMPNKSTGLFETDCTYQ